MVDHCPECDASIPDQPSSCPTCGYPLAADDSAGRSDKGSRSTQQFFDISAKRLGAALGWSLVALASICLLSAIGRFATTQYRKSAERERVQERIQKILSADPTRHRFARFSEITHVDVLRKEVMALSKDRREAWNAFIRDRLQHLYAHTESAASFCESISRADSAGLVEFGGTLIVEPCGRLLNAHKRMQAKKQSIQSQQANLKRRRRARDEAKEDYEEAKRKLEEVESRYEVFTGYIWGKLAPKRYEVSPVHWGRIARNERAVLRTTSTSFTSKGRFKIRVKSLGKRNIQLKNGFNETWPVYVEAEGSMDLKIAKAAKEEAHDRLIRARKKYQPGAIPSSVQETEAYRAYFGKKKALESAIRDYTEL